METARPLRERSLEELLLKVLHNRLEGLVVLRDRDGLRHGIWVHGGFVVGVHVAGRFDPLLDHLRRDGWLDELSYKRCVEALFRSSARSGALAMQLAGVARPRVRDALKAQAGARMHALLEIAASRGYDAGFEARDVPVSEMSVRMPLGSLLRSAALSGTRVALPRELERAEARRRLRELARKLHPDRHMQLDPETRQQLTREMAEATAAYHGFA